jgi:hypothetical protein
LRAILTKKESVMKFAENGVLLQPLLVFAVALALDQSPGQDTAKVDLRVERRLREKAAFLESRFFMEPSNA